MTVQILFYLFAALAIVGALMVITAHNPVKSVLSLVLTFVAAAGVWMLLEAEFLALVLIVVYVGAVMVLFLFVVMMLDVNVEEHKASFVRYWPLALVCGVLVVVMLIWAVGPHHHPFGKLVAPIAHGADYSNIKVLGYLLFTHYVYPFELAAVLLLAAMVSAIALTHHGRRHDRRAQIPSRQIKTDPKSRLRIVKMATEKRPEASSTSDKEAE